MRCDCDQSSDLPGCDSPVLACNKVSAILCKNLSLKYCRRILENLFESLRAFLFARLVSSSRYCALLRWNQGIIRMTGSSDEDDIRPPSVSSTKCRSNKRPHMLISSESNEDEGKARTSRKIAHSLDNRETSVDSDGGISEKCKSTLNSQTPRSSQRLRRKASRSFSMPSREKLLDSVSSGKKQNSQQKVKALKPRKLVNNFLRE